MHRRALFYSLEKKYLHVRNLYKSGTILQFPNLNKTFSLYEMGFASIIKDCGNSRGKTRKGKN